MELTQIQKDTEIMMKALEPTGFTIMIELLDIKKSCTYYGKEIDYDKGMTVGDFPIAIPPEALEREQGYETTGQIYAKVVKVGPHCWTRMHFESDESWCKAGDIIRLAQYGGELVKTPNFRHTTLRLINDADVIAIVDEKLMQDAGFMEDIEIDLSEQ